MHVRCEGFCNPRCRFTISSRNSGMGASLASAAVMAYHASFIRIGDRACLEVIHVSRRPSLTSGSILAMKSSANFMRLTSSVMRDRVTDEMVLVAFPQIQWSRREQGPGPLAVVVRPSCAEVTRMLQHDRFSCVTAVWTHQGTDHRRRGRRRRRHERHGGVVARW